KQNGADHHGPSPEIAEHRGDPPSLASSMDHQRREKKSDQHGTAQVNRNLMPLGRDDEGEEEHEAKDHQGGIVRIEDRPTNSQKMDDGDEGRNGVPAFVYAIVAGSHREKFLTKYRQKQSVRREDA